MDLNQLFLNWVDFVKEARKISYRNIYGRIDISESKGSRIRNGTLNAQPSDLQKLVEVFPELAPLATEANVGVRIPDYDNKQLIPYYRQLVARLEEEVRDLRSRLLQKGEQE